MKTSELIDVALDWAVAHAQGAGSALVLTHSHGQALILSDRTEDCDIGENYQPSINWAQGGPIIEREGIQLALVGDFCWEALRNADGVFCLGRTQLIAAMRCFVASKLGDEIDVPDELVEAVK